MKNNIPLELLDSIYNAVELRCGSIPFKFRGIKISHELIKVTIEVLNGETTKILPQNSRNATKEKTPDGLDKRIKEALNIDLRTANIISDALCDAGIVAIVNVDNPKTSRKIKATRLLEEWYW